MEHENLKEDSSNEDQTRIYKILLLTYAKRLSKYQDQIKNIYFYNSIISNIKDGSHDYLLNEHVTSQHYFIDTLVKSNDSQEFLKSIHLIEEQLNKKENKINEQSSDSFGSNNNNNNGETNNDMINNESSQTDQVNRRTLLNNYIMDVIERSHIFLLLKILFVLFLFEANSKMYFIVSGLFILYNRGFFDVLVNNFSFMSNNESIEQVLRRIRESRNLNNSMENGNIVESYNLNEGTQESNEQNSEQSNGMNNVQNNGPDNEQTNQNCLTSQGFIQKGEEGKETHEIKNEKTAEKTAEKTNVINELSTRVRMESNRENNDDTKGAVGEWSNDGMYEKNDEEFMEKFNDQFNLKITNKNLKETNEKTGVSMDNMDNQKKSSFFLFKKKKLDEEKNDGIELKVKKSSYDEFNSALNVNEKKDHNLKDETDDEFFNGIDVTHNDGGDVGNLANSGIRRRNINNANNKNANYVNTTNNTNDNDNNTYFHDSSTTFNNLLNNSMSEFINSYCNDSEKNSDTSESRLSNESCKKKETDVQNIKNEEDNNSRIAARRKPTKFEKFIYQSVVMFFMTLLPWWVPDVAYLED
ncbi:conserved Plasmodium protein, unknown function [Plasmodium malariae]|uniref:Uncharacterized protein n=1 Tax=Plasmodium malariae TaxID=5858 RepID=A0A1A8WHL9_PLAMA|nr:conserved Plasmodium protein, unknown function [Plasmodium malariae]SBS90715.1 conserved Plasmodium protein, unknown function [Plasmodium malariae]SCP03444.1 conserved Plasmodium protein, unknown function [Plasmodium malariae]